MKSSKKSSNSSPPSGSKSRLRPALTPETRELQLIDLATDLAAQQLMDGTASSQVITHFLKLGTTRAKLEQDKLEKETELLKAKTEALASQEKMEEMYVKAINAMKRYSGNGADEEDFQFDDSDI